MAGSVAGRPSISVSQAFRSPRWSARVLPDYLRETSTPAPGVAEMVAAVRLALARTGHQAGTGVLRLDAITQPVRTRRRARLEPQGLGKPVHMLTLGVGIGVVAVAELLGQVFGQVADAPGRVLRSGEHALCVELSPEPGHVHRAVIGADGGQGVVPVGQGDALRAPRAGTSAGLCLFGRGPAGARRPRIARRHRSTRLIQHAAGYRAKPS